MNGEELRCAMCSRKLGYTMIDGRKPAACFCTDCFPAWKDMVTEKGPLTSAFRKGLEGKE